MRVRETERRKVRARPDLSDNLQIPHKGKGTSETAGALGNNALLSFSFTSGPKRTWKPTTHTDKTSHCCYCRLSTWRIRGSAFYLQTPPCPRKKPETNKTGTHLKKKKNPLISDNCMQNKEKYSEAEEEPHIYKENVWNFFSWELSQGQRGSERKREVDNSPWRENFSGNKQQIDRTEWTREGEKSERKRDGEGSKSWIIGSESRLRSPRARRHSLNLKRRCGIMKMWPLINIWGAKQVGWHAAR